MGNIKTYGTGLALELTIRMRKEKHIQIIEQ